MDEGEVGVAERIGVSSQVWLLRSFTDRTVLALGFGAYGVRDQLDRTDAIRTCSCWRRASCSEAGRPAAQCVPSFSSQ